VVGDATVYRGIALPEGAIGRLVPGATITDLGYMSTAAWAAAGEMNEETGFPHMTDPKIIATEFAQLRATGSAGDLNPSGARVFGGTAVVLEIRLSDGQPCVRGDRSVGELVLPRGTSFTVLGTRDDGTIVTEVSK
jgi:hypothetical protein